MYKYLVALLPCLVNLNLYAASGENARTENTPPATGQHHLHFANEDMRDKLYGTVMESMDVGGYTYVHIDTGTDKVWAAAPRMPVNRGSRVGISTRMPMTHFHSTALNRDFELIYFTDRITGDALSNSGTAAPAPQDNTGKESPDAPVNGIQKAKDGKTIAEILQQKKALAGQPVRVRGKVVKYSARVLGKNWMHIRDSSTSKDLAITTNDTARVGDIILANGKLALDRDFGYGYVYEVLLEDSAVTVE